MPICAAEASQASIQANKVSNMTKPDFLCLFSRAYLKDVSPDKRVQIIFRRNYWEGSIGKNHFLWIVFARPLLSPNHLLKQRRGIIPLRIICIHSKIKNNLFLLQKKISSFPELENIRMHELFTWRNVIKSW